MTEHYTRDEILAKMRYSTPRLEDWRQRFDALYRVTLLPAVVWRLQCYDLMQRAQLQLTYTPKPKPTINCARCHLKRPQIGSGLRFVLGMRRAVCSKCAASIDRAKRR